MTQRMMRMRMRMMTPLTLIPSQMQNSSQDLARIAAETKETLKWFKL